MLSDIIVPLIIIVLLCFGLSEAYAITQDTTSRDRVGIYDRKLAKARLSIPVLWLCLGIMLAILVRNLVG